ncbi:uncharacterized protein BP01DRAFT_360785 [Aspergillus saccharolyticus JOP 1030-1]|uniref:Uncharacterized protein n=1 Tax=Aspergillus saccharolyticus JOP 1030-1 TaxID=1450539 RepID=A0A318Z152_9EURO|nr:hypothetical protein BP01DRAFT_360785 [Aspergillus saccharolyticus JOP 1030-1]PYH41031.1 hypothetical protein BP01DRAFT_360785 [Aspergillus saccharolyticus JOP 1030-1]
MAHRSFTWTTTHAPSAPSRSQADSLSQDADPRNHGRDESALSRSANDGFDSDHEFRHEAEKGKHLYHDEHFSFLFRRHPRCVGTCGFALQTICLRSLFS